MQGGDRRYAGAAESADEEVEEGGARPQHRHHPHQDAGPGQVTTHYCEMPLPPLIASLHSRSCSDPEVDRNSDDLDCHVVEQILDDEVLDDDCFLEYNTPDTKSMC